MRFLLILTACIQLFSGAGADWDAARAVLAMRGGVTLRLHVVAESDAPQDQAVKAPIRDAVRAAYAAGAQPGRTMLENAQALLPTLTDAAVAAARDAGYPGAVAVTIEQTTFDERTLDGLTFPAGVYPALLVKLGKAQGHNWWGLLDPDFALASACIQPLAEGEDVRLVWSLSPLWRWLFGLGEAQA